QGENVQFGLGLTGAYKMNEITDIGEFAGNTGGQGVSAVKIGWPYPSRTVQYTITRAEVDPKGQIVLENGQRVQLYCDSGVLPDAALNSSDPKQKNPLTSQYGMTLGGPEVVCQTLAGQRVLWGPSFSPYSWTVSPSLNIHNVVQIT